MQIYMVKEFMKTNTCLSGRSIEPTRFIFFIKMKLVFMRLISHQVLEFI